MTKKKFDHKILIIGYGSVSQCTLPILFEHLKVDPKNVTIIDFEDNLSETALPRKIWAKSLQNTLTKTA